MINVSHLYQRNNFFNFSYQGFFLQLKLSYFLSSFFVSVLFLLLLSKVDALELKVVPATSSIICTYRICYCFYTHTHNLGRSAVPEILLRTLIYVFFSLSKLSINLLNHYFLLMASISILTIQIWNSANKYNKASKQNF